MLNLYQIYENFLTLFRRNKQAKSDKEHIASLFFGIMDKDKDAVDIKCVLPDIQNKNITEISEIAERFAQLLVLLNTDHFNKNIYNILTKQKKVKAEDYKTIMLIDNIISYWDIFYNLQNKTMQKKYKSKEPMVKPSEAFKVK